MTDYNNPGVGSPLPVRTGGAAPVFSAFSIIGVILALITFVVTPGLAFFAAIGAIIFGLLGMFVAFLPSRRGGILSFIAVGIGLLAVVIALFRLLAGGGDPQPY